ncbi:hypothetical protein [Streptomyces sp. NPDC091215]|uniref:hypothetical protein n=1 Tax=Streptomyces sp. NPDC091215 TaxID=3155192 RepID=UPI00343A344B
MTPGAWPVLGHVPARWLSACRRIGDIIPVSLGSRRVPPVKMGKTAKSTKEQLEQLGKGELYGEAARRDVASRSKMNRDQLIHALKAAS